MKLVSKIKQIIGIKKIYRMKTKTQPSFNRQELYIKFLRFEQKLITLTIKFKLFFLKIQRL